MLFSSIPFLFYFLPCVFVLYFLVPMRWKNTVLLLASLFFYAWGEPKFVVFMLASIVQGYVLARLVEKYRARGVKTERSLNRDNITWTVSAQLPEGDNAPRPSRVWQSKAWG